ncbi:proline-rich protein 33 isoform X2 [Macrotis lagotis]
MLITVPMPHEPGSPYPPALPPPLLPKPAKDNLRLQKLLKKTAKKKASLTTLQTSAFRASLSPVSEASHDQDAGPQPWTETPRAVAPLAPPAPPSLPAPHAPPTSLAPHAPPTLPAPLAPSDPPRPLALPTPPRVLVPTTRSPYKPIIQHVSSPLQKKTFTFNLTEQRSLAEHFRMTTPQFGGPGPDTPKALGSFVPVSAPREATHVSRIHIHVQPVLSPQSPDPATHVSWGPEPQERPGDHEQEVATPQPVAPHQPSPMLQIPVAHIQPLTPNVQATNHCPEPPSSARLSPSGEAAAPKQVITKIVVPIAPTYRSPGPSQHSPLPRAPSTKAEPPPVPPKPNTVYPKFASASDTKQQSPGPLSPSRAFSPETPSKPLVTVLSPTPSGEGAKEAPTPIPKTRFSGWTRLKKQLIVAPEAPPFPEPEGAEAQPEQAGGGSREPATIPATPRPPVSRATRMWDAVLYRMSVAKGGNQLEDTKEGSRALPGGLLGRGNFLPFLYRPRFDARKLREMATQPPPQINSVSGVSLRPSIAPKNFNRTAACWRLK